MAQEEHFLGKVAQKAIISSDDKVLLTRDPRTPDTWELPGGRLNIDENPKDGLKREIREELGIDCKIEEIVFLKQFTYNNQRSLVLVYKATLPSPSTITVDPREVIEYKWFSKEEVTGLKLFPEYKEALDIFYSLS